MLTGPAHALGFGRVDGYEPPQWPDERGGKQFHLDLAVADLDEAQEDGHRPAAATVVDPQPGETWRVLRRPERPPVLPDQGRELGLSRGQRPTHQPRSTLFEAGLPTG